ncbi:SgcJ/EcaC family oxidoreductase [Candidatus Gracilibacteria bacterium]|nr:SgcJ/EcaC family oxidoreductase [Candidatus Gracilibacteria bacterium]NJM89424.1 SgcJ/EcaC family oxidoreductase [Hydrococcus sp. RU_2_2]NJP20174.1 SgcJ/EcaC family oxidoreductase [Hydrococcus sp. CRU_1_1]
MSTSSTIFSDETAVQAIMTKFVDAWNVHDAKSYAALFAEDGDFVNVMGLWMKGRSAIEKGHAQVFSTFLSDSYLKITDTQIKFLKPDVAILHCTWEITGQKSPDGNHILQNTGVWTAIAARQETNWQIVALQNTGLIPMSVNPLQNTT